MKKVLSTLFVLSLIVVAGVSLIGKKEVSTLGSVNVGNDYKSVVTATYLTANKDLLCLGSGSVGSVVITGAAAGTFELLDASTTNASLRTITATSSLRKIASFPTSAAVGDYIFDASFYNGLVVEFIGTQGTTTITYRCQ